MKSKATFLAIAFATTLFQPGSAQTITEFDGLQIEQGALPIELKGHKINLEVRIFRPAGPGPFPLVVINHGTPISISDARSVKLGFTQASEWFARRGFEVVVAL